MLSCIRTICTEPSTRIDCTSRPERGPKRTSFSCGYCDSQARSAPRSTMPICISNKRPALPLAYPAYRMATPRSVVVDMKAASMPPLTPKSFAVQNESGRDLPAKPRYTGIAFVSFDSLTMHELMTCSVVVYKLGFSSCGPPHSFLKGSRKPGGSLSRQPRSTLLYLTKRGPVYSRPPISSSTVISGSLRCSSREFQLTSFASNSASGCGLRRCLSSILPMASVCHVSGSGMTTKHHSCLDVV
mmetsp:Transcript_30395/g.97015  ORF Transcript_30395/g.97015 Transcript_30395/m.97015 type:complete len:243 (+) Transcript_30395:173-901(+)